ncbi:MAG: hypothetical protein DRI44_02435 [Chlamydiae bacterium]|nr:MAG: hypothetical protein DRI44_02435 [Chlamydiota bacterium]
MLNIKHQQRRGIALVAILAVLTVLGIMASAFIIQMRMENKTAETFVLKSETDMLMLAATEHAKAQIYNDSITSPGLDSASESWSSAFTTTSKGSGKAINLSGLPADNNSINSRWFYVRDKTGAIVGRYAISIEDEAGKINVNAASSLNNSTQNQGINTSEIIISDGKKRGIPIGIKSVKKIIAYRYGRDKAPGQRNIDDNANNVSLMYDGIDNDGDGVIDESDEGIDEPEEYNRYTPYWDDRAFSSVNDIADICGIKSIKGKSLLKRYCTIYSDTRDTYWDDEKAKMQLPINVNVSTTRQIHKVLKRGNSQHPFEGSSRNLRILAANISDYRDENQVLTTIGSDYGIESICFNEIMAMNGNFTLESDYEGWAPRLGYWYNHYSETQPNYKYNFRSSWSIKNVSKGGNRRSVQMAGEKLSLPFAKITLNEPERWTGTGGSKSLFKQLTKGGWLPDVFKNAYFILIKNKAGTDRIYYPISGNGNHSLEVCYDNSKDFNFFELTNKNTNARIEIDTLWWCEAANWCVFPEQTEMWWVRTQFDPKIRRPDSLYYYLYFAEQSFDRDIGANYAHYPLTAKGKMPTRRPYKGYNPYMDTDGSTKSRSETRMDVLTAGDLKGTTLKLPAGEKEIDLLRTPYKNGEAIRAKNGFIQVIVTSGKNTGYVGGMKRTSDKKAFENKNCIDAMYVMRPDIVELMNVSDRPISLNNWQIIVNTGDSVNRVGLIRDVPHYSVDRHGRYNDPNPTIPAHGYFYLTNNRNYFDKVYGTAKSGTWGDSQSEGYGCYELPKSLWGVRYKIVNIKKDKVKVKGANWKKDQMKGEMVEFQSTKPHPHSNGISGIRRGIVGNTKDILHLNVDAYGTGVRNGDDAMIVGLPGAGGFLSMTLKNEYNQIATRIVEYGSLDPSDIEYSTQKVDPTRYDWQISKHPTFGGKEDLARNNGVSANVKNQANIKNGRFSSLAEFQAVKTAKKFESVGSTKSDKGNFPVLKAVSKYFTTSGIRLDPEEKGVHISGWTPTFSVAAYSKAGLVKAENVSWESDIWKYQKLRILSGKQRGETFLVTGNTANSVKVDGYSVPGGKLLSLSKGDSFTLGPGYSTPMFYTRKEAEPGEWEWKKSGLRKTYYGLYLGGLNDSIDTTEFLEENYNAQIEVQAFNFATHKYDSLPIDYNNKDLDDLYGKPGSKTGRFQYEKNDVVFCGFIGPEYISPESGIRVKLIPHGLNNTKSYGFAWFDYIYLTPGSSSGKININTALPRILSSLKGINQNLAKNIYRGVNSFNKPVLKPYKDITDLLDVKDMTTRIYSDICNLITVRSDQFRVNITVQTLKNARRAESSQKNKDYEVTSISSKSFILDRQNLTSIFSPRKQFDVIMDR